jgi:hypothetical protein
MALYISAKGAKSQAEFPKRLPDSPLLLYNPRLDLTKGRHTYGTSWRQLQTPLAQQTGE